MKRQGKAWLAAGVLAISGAACFSDPTSDLRNGPSRLQLSRRYIVQNVGDTDVVNIQVLDAQGNPLSIGGVAFSSADQNVADMAPLPDSSLRTFPGATLTKAVVVAKGAGTTKVTVTADGVTDTVTVLSFPVSFPGTVSATTVTEGDSIVLTGTSAIGFSTATTAELGGHPAFIKSQSANHLTIFAGQGGAGQQIVLHDLTLLGTIPVATLPVTQTITVNAPATEPGNNNPGGRVVTPPTTTGAFIEFIASINGQGSCGPLGPPNCSGTWTGAAIGADVDDYFSWTATTTDSLEIVLDWPRSGIDIDAVVFDGAGNCVQAPTCPGATGADPERVRFRQVIGTQYFIDVNLWDYHGIATPEPYRIRIYKRG